MARDYASRQRKRIKPEAGAEAAEKAAPKTRGAVPRPVEEEADVAVEFWARLPGWGWLAIGLVAGFLVANLGQPSAPTPLQEKPPLAFVETKDTVKDDVKVEAKVPAKPSVDKAAANPSAQSANSEVSKLADKEVEKPAPRFDFYTLLPESEVVAPEVEAYKSTPREAEDQPRYMLQVGSFRSSSDAKKQQERLKALNYDNTRISEIETASGDTWYRVQVGPYQDRRLLASVQNNLAKSGLDFMMLRLKDEPTPQSTTQK